MDAFWLSRASWLLVKEGTSLSRCWSSSRRWLAVTRKQSRERLGVAGWQTWPQQGPGDLDPRPASTLTH